MTSSLDYKEKCPFLNWLNNCEQCGHIDECIEKIKKEDIKI